MKKTAMSLPEESFLPWMALLLAKLLIEQDKEAVSTHGELNFEPWEGLGWYFVHILRWSNPLDVIDKLPSSLSIIKERLSAFIVKGAMRGYRINLRRNDNSLKRKSPEELDSQFDSDNPPTIGFEQIAEEFCLQGNETLTLPALNFQEDDPADFYLQNVRAIQMRFLLQLNLSLEEISILELPSFLKEEMMEILKESNLSSAE